MNSLYPNLSEDELCDVIIEAQKHKIDLTEADKTVKFYNENGSRFGAEEPIMIIDVCAGLYIFNNQKKSGNELIRSLNLYLFNIGYLEDQSSWNEFSEIIANSDILEGLQ